MKLLDFNDADFIRTLFEEYPPIFSEFTFSNLMMWRKQRPTYIENIEGTCIFLVEVQNELMAFGPPLGPAPLHEILLKLPVKKIIRSSLPNEDIPQWQFTSSPDDADYVYRVSNLIEYPGHQYHRKRQLMRGCLNRYQCQYESLTGNNIPECLELQQRIIDMMVPDDCQLKEHRAAEYLLQEFSRFHSFGGVIRINGTVEGVMIASRLNATTAVGHVEKTNPDIHGISSLLHHWFAAYELKQYKFFNIEQDLGILGLRDSKSRFIPDHMVVKFTGVKP